MLNEQLYKNRLLGICPRKLSKMVKKSPGVNIYVSEVIDTNIYSEITNYYYFFKGKLHQLKKGKF